MIENERIQLRHLALDMDGTLYKGGTLFPFTRPFLERLRDLGIGYTFFTNNSSKSVEDYIRHLSAMGIEADVSQVYTSTLATIDYLKRELPGQKRAFVVGTRSMIGEFAAAGFEHCDDDPELVIVGFDPAMDFTSLCRAAYWITQGKTFVATHPDRICPTDQPTVLIDCGAVCAALTAATGRKPELVLGKPHPAMVDGILKRHGLQPAEMAVVGDRLYTDVAMAQAIGALGILVLTGETTREVAEAADPAPDMILESVEELGARLEAPSTRSTEGPNEILRRS